MGFVPPLDGPRTPLGTWLRQASTQLLGSRDAVGDGFLERVGGVDAVVVGGGGAGEGQGGRMFGREGWAEWVEVAVVVVVAVVGLMRRWRNGR